MISRQDRISAYKELIAELIGQKQKLTAGDGRFTILRVASFAVTILTLAYAFFDRGLSFWWVLFPGAIFTFIVVIHEGRLKAAGRTQKRVEFYKAGIRRIEGEWQNDGLTGDDFIDQEHLFSGDLNLFGKSSLFQKVSLCVTAFGRQRLAAWLTCPADSQTLKKRQEAIKELSEDKRLIAKFAELDIEATENLKISTLKSWSSEGSKVYNPIVYFFSLL